MVLLVGMSLLVLIGYYSDAISIPMIHYLNTCVLAIFIKCIANVLVQYDNKLNSM